MEEAISAIKAMGITQDEDHIKEILRRCNNNAQEAVQMLLPESPMSESNVNILEGYRDINPPRYTHEDSQDSRDSYDVDMRDTETHPGSGGESDHNSTTVSYSLEEDTIQDIEEDIREGEGHVRHIQEEEEEEEEFRRIGGQQEYEYGPQVHEGSRYEGQLPRYEDIVSNNQREVDSSPPPLLREQEDKLATPTPQDVGVVEDGSGMTSSIEFPLTHYYELEGRVHTDQWSIPYKRDESLSICMVAAIRMIREGK